jgi:hypothetical protein
MTKTTHKPMSRASAEQFLAGALSDLPDQFLGCRDLRHSWVVQDNFDELELELEGQAKPQRAVFRVLKCRECHTLRTDTYLVIDNGHRAPRLEKWSASYKYPDGYQMKRGQLPRDLAVNQLVRYETLRRVVAATAR